jgi:hypothetical protein
MRSCQTSSKGCRGVRRLGRTWQRANRAGHRDRQLPVWVVETEKDLSDGDASKISGIELLDDRVGMVGDPGFSDRFARDKDDDGWDACSLDGFDEVELRADELQVRAVHVFACRRVETCPEFGLVPANMKAKP